MSKFWMLALQFHTDVSLVILESYCVPSASHARLAITFLLQISFLVGKIKPILPSGVWSNTSQRLGIRPALAASILKFFLTVIPNARLPFNFDFG
ncbi:hypothetical protein C8R45DRAFT_1110276 [Mycena sanguinolenta]|nr:hypothetical protein C8R45DRAFT_1110276 [Mycena sanguinolenta]